MTGNGQRPATPAPRHPVTVAGTIRPARHSTGGTGIGLQNLRERLRLTYGERAAFSIVSNFPSGVAATLTLPLPATIAAAGKEERRDV